MTAGNCPARFDVITSNDPPGCYCEHPGRCHDVNTVGIFMALLLRLFLFAIRLEQRHDAITPEALEPNNWTNVSLDTFVQVKKLTSRTMLVVGAGIGGRTNNDCETDREWECSRYLGAYRYQDTMDFL
jgi:hypothetical protein